MKTATEGIAAPQLQPVDLDRLATKLSHDGYALYNRRSVLNLELPEYDYSTPEEELILRSLSNIRQPGATEPRTPRYTPTAEMHPWLAALSLARLGGNSFGSPKFMIIDYPLAVASPQVTNRVIKRLGHMPEKSTELAFLIEPKNLYSGRMLSKGAAARTRKLNQALDQHAVPRLIIESERLHFQI